MAVDIEIFRGFRQQIGQLAGMAAPTDMSDEERVARAKGVFDAKLDNAKASHLEACVHCGICAEACHFYVQTQDPKYTPIRKLDLLKRHYRREKSGLRWLYRRTTRDITAQELEQWQELVYDSCTECGRCGTVCPMGIDIAGMVNVMRQALAEAGLIPAELRAVQQEQGGRGTVFGVGSEQLMAAAEQLRAQGLEVPVNQPGVDVMVLSTVVDVMLFKDALEATVRIMNHLGVSWSLCSEATEAANFGLLSGNESVQKAASDRIVKAAVTCGAKVVVLPECGHAYPALRWEGANAYGRPLPFEVMAISEFLGREVQAGRLKLKPLGKDRKITYHDPCKLGRHGGIFHEPRAIFEALDVDMREMPSHGRMNFCCGGGAGVFLINRAAPLRKATFELKREEVESVGADSLVTSCGSCRLNFLAGADAVQWDRKIESLVELVGQNLADTN